MGRKRKNNNGFCERKLGTEKTSQLKERIALERYREMITREIKKKKYCCVVSQFQRQIKDSTYLQIKEVTERKNLCKRGFFGGDGKHS